MSNNTLLAILVLSSGFLIVSAIAVTTQIFQNNVYRNRKIIIAFSLSFAATLLAFIGSVATLSNRFHHP